MTRNLVRTQGGRMIHRAECHMAQRGNATPWLWADEVSEVEVANALATFGYRRCNRCKPLPGFMGRFPWTA